MHTDRWLDVVFGKGDDDYPFWLMAVRVNVLLFLLCAAAVLAWHLAQLRGRRVAKGEAALALALTGLAALLRFAVASANLMDFGGVAYSRLLWGYKGHFAAAQFYSPFYELTARDIEHAILFDRIAATLTIPLVYLLCRLLRPQAGLFVASSAFLFAVYPLHVLFSASDALAVFSLFLAAASYALLAGAEKPANRRLAGLHYLGGFSGLALLTQARYENVLLLLPPALLLLRRRSALRSGALAAPLGVAAVLLGFYAYAALSSGLSYRNPLELERGLDLALRHLLLNPFLAIPALLAGAAAVWVYAGWRLGAVTLVPWVAAFLLCVTTAGDGHGAARIFANWLILLLPIAGYGFSLLAGAPRLVPRLAAALALLYFAALPVVLHDRLAAQYLEILENDRFKSILATLPRGVERLIVPDDERMWREERKTIEFFRKYQAIHWGAAPAGQGVTLVALTDYLAATGREGCGPDACLFFSGVPCMEGIAHPATREQCDELLRRRRTSVVDETTVVAAPFVACSIYVGKMERELCEPATRPRRFVLYRIEG